MSGATRVPEPSLLFDSAGLRIRDFEKLEWRNIYGEKTAPPPDSDPLFAVASWPDKLAGPREPAR